MIRIVLFVACTLFFICFSWRSLKNPGTHGFYRFFVFEGTLALVLLNHPYWFVAPFSPLQIVSWFLLLTSICLVIHSLMLLKQSGGYAEREDTPENLSFENTVNVVDDGIYRYIRHPMYSSLFFLAWGAFCKQITPLRFCLVLVVSGFLVAAARVEEKENSSFFGVAYDEYMKRTKMFIPWLL